jgi:glycogen phosphorylase
MKNKKSLDVAYFSMEVAFRSEVPNYAGGLGVLAADMMYSCADLGINAAGVTLIYHLDDDPKTAFPIANYLKPCKERIFVRIEDRDVQVAIWKWEIKGKKTRTPVFFLSTNLPENKPWDRDITKNLYASDPYTRMSQEAILGIGGVRALDALGYQDAKCYHMNEGHCSFLTLELLRKYAYNENETRALSTFTTHTPLPSGHDFFDYDLVHKTLGDIIPWNIRKLASDGNLKMTDLALSLSREANGVSKKHSEICRAMFPNYKFKSITNGIYHSRWTGKAMSSLFDRTLKNWKNNPEILSRAKKNITTKDLKLARKSQKIDFIRWVNSNASFFPFGSVEKEDKFSSDVLTIGFARRFVPYKRPELIFSEKDILKKIGNKRLQLVFASHCHPSHMFCTDTMKNLGRDTLELRGQVRIAVIPDYNLDISKRLVSGCDVWLNTPIPPLEASGTSGMKAAMNGCLNLSVADGWWIEGQKIEPLAGWTFGKKAKDDNLRDKVDARDLMKKLEDIIDCYYNRKKEWAERMKKSIALGAYFNTHRVCQEYQEKLWTSNEKK